MRYHRYTLQLAATSGRQPAKWRATRQGTAAATSQTYMATIWNAHGPHRIKATSRHAAGPMLTGSTSHPHPGKGLSDAVKKWTSTPASAIAMTDSVTPRNAT